MKLGAKVRSRIGRPDGVVVFHLFWLLYLVETTEPHYDWEGGEDGYEGYWSFRWLLEKI